MAPAIAHFLVGAALLLLIASPVVLQYEIDRAYLVWLIPLGGLWGLGPDIHHIGPIFTDSLYAFHNSPWADLFALHYTLDMSAVRAHYHASVFGSIVIFIGAIGIFWTAGWMQRSRLRGFGAMGRLIAWVLATGISTFCLYIALSVQGAVPLLADILGTGEFVAVALVLAVGTLAGIPWAILQEGVLTVMGETQPLVAGAVGGAIGGGAWLALVGLGLPFMGGTVQITHLGSFLAGIGYGMIFGIVYGSVRSSVRRPRGRRLEDEVESIQKSWEM